MLADNLGYGELGVYGGGILRGAPTPRIDRLAAEGTRLLNFNVEAQCTPSRSALMTGRFAIRSGTYEVPIGGAPDGLTLWEVTIAELLSGRGYATGIWGKWHLGSAEERLPTNQGFDEWYGIPRTLANFASADVPKDRPIDGVDQSDFLLGRQETSNREGFPAYVADRLSAVKWRNWKAHLIWQEDMYAPPQKLPSPKIINLLTDLKEERDTAAHNSWVAEPVVKFIRELEASLTQYPPIKAGTPDPYTPPTLIVPARN